ncbi:MAG: carbon storage regulator [Gammaproteobacteria bacterium]|nr:carbon storage regulator [Gammaproteobacteria bacterium]
MCLAAQFPKGERQRQYMSVLVLAKPPLFSLPSLPTHRQIKRECPFMLMYTRRIGEQLRIGRDTLLTVVAIREGEVRINVEGGGSCSVVTRGIGRTLNLGNDIVITVLIVKEREVRLGIEVALTIPVYREELHKLICNATAVFASRTDADSRRSRSSGGVCRSSIVDYVKS